MFDFSYNLRYTCSFLPCGLSSGIYESMKPYCVFICLMLYVPLFCIRHGIKKEMLLCGNHHVKCCCIDICAYLWFIVLINVDK